MRLVTNALSAMISQTLADQGISIREGARRCDLSLGRFADVLYARTQRPTPETLDAISRGLSLPYNRLALAAYGVIVDPATVPA